jgi:hypothetical protein
MTEKLSKFLNKAKTNKADEFYTQYIDIEKEINSYLEYDKNVFRDKTILLPCDDPEWSNFTKYFAQNFENFGLKKLISTSYAPESKRFKDNYQPTWFEVNDPQYDESKTSKNGKIFTLCREKKDNKRIDINDLKWTYLKGDGDFNSEEIKNIRDEADIIITNPPFSLFRNFLKWIITADKKFLIIGNINAITYKEVFPQIKDNKIWLGTGMGRWISGFIVPESYELYGTEARVDNEGNRIISTNNCLWLTNLDHGKRHRPLSLMTMNDNIRYNKKIKNKGYPKYDNYDAIEVSYTDAIPNDYDEIMGVPITFLDKYNPDQFEILGATQRGCHKDVIDTRKYDDYWEVRQNGIRTGSSGGKTNENANLLGNDGKKNYFINNEGRIIQSVYQRIFIKRIREKK